MHVTKKRDGSFAVKDLPTKVSGKAAERILLEMRSLDSSPISAERRAFLDECSRIYAESHHAPPP